MEQYVLKVTLMVGVDAPSPSDAIELLQDMFGEDELEGFGVTCYSFHIDQVDD